MKVAAFQMPFPTAAREHNLEQIVRRLEWAHQNRVDLACFPECFLTGYFTRAEEAEQVALSLDSPEFAAVLGRLEAFPTTAVIGLIERDGGQLFNTAVVIRAGEPLGKYRKTHPNEKCFAAGAEHPVFEVAGLRFGVNICFDANFPGAAAKVAAAGAQLLLYPLNNALPAEIAERWREKSPENLASRARETGCWVVSADVAGRGQTLLGFGCSQIVDPAGCVRAAVPELEAGVAALELTGASHD